MKVVKGDKPTTLHTRQGQHTNYVVMYVSHSKESNKFKCFIFIISNVAIPKSLADAQSDPRQKRVMQEEMTILIENNTCHVRITKEIQLVGCKWVYTIKHQLDGTNERYKVRLVAKAFN